tara:strand:- start:43 stop:333 length:291 start_codon:yes stop_codon:yes gene_type:complete
MITIADALQSLRPKAQFAVRGDVIEWLDTEQTQPSQSEIDAEVIRLQAEYDAKEYQRKRKTEYPTLEECVHAILDDTLTDLQTKRTAVKNKYPKGV